MENLIENIDSINKEIEAKANQYKDNLNITPVEPNININDDILSDKFLEAYPNNKPTERIIGYLPLK